MQQQQPLCLLCVRPPRAAPQINVSAFNDAQAGSPLFGILIAAHTHTPAYAPPRCAADAHNRLQIATHLEEILVDAGIH